jgi:hypothetical protein
MYSKIKNIKVTKEYMVELLACDFNGIEEGLNTISQWDQYNPPNSS